MTHVLKQLVLSYITFEHEHVKFRESFTQKSDPVEPGEEVRE